MILDVFRVFSEEKLDFFYASDLSDDIKRVKAWNQCQCIDFIVLMTDSFTSSYKYAGIYDEVFKTYDD